MEPLQRYRAMQAFCRQRAKMDGEEPGFWLAEAEAWERKAHAMTSQFLPDVARRQETAPPNFL